NEPPPRFRHGVDWVPSPAQRDFHPTLRCRTNEAEVSSGRNASESARPLAAARPVQARAPARKNAPETRAPTGPSGRARPFFRGSGSGERAVVSLAETFERRVEGSLGVQGLVDRVRGGSEGFAGRGRLRGSVK